MTYKGQGRFKHILESIGLIKTAEWRRMYPEDESAVEDHNRMVRDG